MYCTCASPPSFHVASLNIFYQPVLQLVNVRSGELESALLMLPLTDALHLMEYLPMWLDQVGFMKHPF